MYFVWEVNNNLCWVFGLRGRLMFLRLLLEYRDKVFKLIFLLIKDVVNCFKFSEVINVIRVLFFVFFVLMFDRENVFLSLIDFKLRMLFNEEFS